MANRKVDDTSLASVADAIRAKGGTSDALVFPDGFVSAISAIQTGGGGGGISIVSDGEGNVTITASGSAVVTSDGEGNVVIQGGSV